MAEYTSFKVPELRKLLSERSLPQTGNKTELIARLTENDKAGDAPAETKTEEAKKPGTCPAPVDFLFTNCYRRGEQGGRD